MNIGSKKVRDGEGLRLNILKHRGVKIDYPENRNKISSQIFHSSEKAKPSQIKQQAEKIIENIMKVI